MGPSAHTRGELTYEIVPGCIFHKKQGILMNVLIVDDEAPAREYLRHLLETEHDVTVVGESAGGSDAIQKVNELAPDVLFLDIQMPKGSGFDLLSQIPEQHRPLVIFVTAYNEYAIPAFDEAALDYVLKPIDPKRFATACARAREQLTKNVAPDTFHAHPMSNASGHCERLIVKGGNRVIVLSASEIRWVTASGNYVRIVSAPGTFVVRETMAELERCLNPSQFVRIHRSTIVNLDYIKEMQPWFSGELIVIMKDDTEFKLSRSFRGNLEKRLKWLS